MLKSGNLEIFHGAIFEKSEILIFFAWFFKGSNRGSLDCESDTLSIGPRREEVAPKKNKQYKASTKIDRN